MEAASGARDPELNPSGRRVTTVLGDVDASALGFVLNHEHLLVRLWIPEDARSERFSEPLRWSNLGWVRQYWASSADNTRLTSERLAIQELHRYKAAGGGTLVELTLPGAGRRPAALKRISEATGVHIIMGCGAYVAPTHPSWIRRASAERIAERLVAEATYGVGSTGIRAGVIGEIGCSWPLNENERKVLIASALAQRQTGLPISVHPGRNRKAPFEIIDVLDGAGADLERVAIGHLDRTIQDINGLLRLARLGCYLELDFFGLETSYFPFEGVAEGLSDAQRLQLVRGLVDGGYLNRLLLSQDICQKHRLAKYGGHGYNHLISNVLPWMRKRGFAERELDSILRTNPATFLGH